MAHVEHSNVAEGSRPPYGDLKVAATLLLIALLALGLTACGQSKGHGSPVFDLAHERPALTVTAAHPDDGLISVAAGDVNGDGRPDLIVGAWRADGLGGSRPDCGEAYVIFGRATQRAPIELAQGDQDVTILGADSEDLMGYAVATGDVNGDGIDDILLGAPLADGLNNDRPQAGEAYVILGSPSLEPTIDLALGQQALTLFGAEKEDRLGISVASGDANDDGTADILAGAFLADGPDNARYAAGEAYLVFGGPSLGGARDVAQGEYDLAIIAANADEQLGYAVAMGDLNADSIDDPILGAFRSDGPNNARNDAGQVYVIYGSRALGGTQDLATASANLTVAGADAEDDLGAAVTSADVNADGVADLLIGAPRADGPDEARDRAGEAYVIFGSPSLKGTVDIDQAEEDVTILGADPVDHLGTALDIGDIDGDGTDDLVLGAPGADGPENARKDAGDAYVVLGSPSLGPVIDISLGEQGATMFGEQEGDAFATRIAVADWDSDGRADVLATAPNGGAESSPGRAGRAYVISIGPRLRDSQ